MDKFCELIAGNFFFVAVAACFIVGMLLKSITTIVTSGAREKSRREIAAYIAEGTLTAEQGERLLKAERGQSHEG